MNILIAGGSGFLGSKIVEGFAQHSFINFSKTHKNQNCVSNIILDLSQNIDSLELSFTGNIDLIINCIDSNETKEERIRNDIVDSVVTLINIAQKNNIKKIIHFSINDAENVKDSYQKAKVLAERAVENSNLDYIILKLSPISGKGSKLDFFLNKILTKSNKMPIIGEKSDKIAPIHYKDIIANIAVALEKDAVWGHTYSLCGPEYMSLQEIMQRHTNEDVKTYSRPKIFERFYLNTVPSSLRRFAISIAYSYYQDSTYIHNPIVRPTIFY